MGAGLADELSGGGGLRAARARAAALRAAHFLATLAGAALLLSALLWAAPGDPIDLLPNGDELRPALEAAWALDRPLLERVARGLLSAATGDLGVSLTVRPGAPVAELLAPAAARSALLLFPALALGVGAALALAWVTAGRESRARRVVQVLSAPPVFLMAFLLVTGINAATWALLERGIIARPDWFALPDQPSLMRGALAVGVLAWASGALASLHAGCEDEIARVRDSAYVDGALALGERVWPVVLRNLAPPLCTLAARRVAALIGGLVVIEKVLLLNGAGALLWEAALRRDYPLAMGIGLAAAAAVAAAQLIADLLRLAIDPRLRAEAP